MAAGHDAQKAGERVEVLLAEPGSQAGPQVAATAEELVSCLVELYGAGWPRSSGSSARTRRRTGPAGG